MLFSLIAFWMIWFECFMVIFFLIHNIASVRKTEIVLAKRGLRQKRVSPVTAWKRFFIRTFDYKSRASLSEFWWVALPLKIFLICLAWVIGIIFGFSPLVTCLILCGLFLLFLLPILSLCVRRFKDVNIGAWFSIFILLCAFVINYGFIYGPWRYALTFPDSFVMMLAGVVAYGIVLLALYHASDPYENVYGKVPNLEPLPKGKFVIEKVTKRITGKGVTKIHKKNTGKK